MTRKASSALDRYLLPLSMVVVALAMFACNTTEGVGKDIEATGDAIKDTAQDAKD